MSMALIVIYYNRRWSLSPMIAFQMKDIIPACLSLYQSFDFLLI